MIGAKRRPSGSLLVLSFSSRGYLRSLLTFNHPDVAASLVTTMGEASPIARSRPSGAPMCCCRPSPSPFDHPDIAASLVTTMGEALPAARSSVGSYVLLPSFSFLLDGPFSAMRCAPWSTRSQIASATVGSAR
jgi:hypothetical protein